MSGLASRAIVKRVKSVKRAGHRSSVSYVKRAKRIYPQKSQIAALSKERHL